MNSPPSTATGSHLKSKLPIGKASCGVTGIVCPISRLRGNGVGVGSGVAVGVRGGWVDVGGGTVAPLSSVRGERQPLTKTKTRTPPPQPWKIPFPSFLYSFKRDDRIPSLCPAGGVFGVGGAGMNRKSVGQPTEEERPQPHESPHPAPRRPAPCLSRERTPPTPINRIPAPTSKNFGSAHP